MTADSSVVLPLMHSCAHPPRPGIIVRLFLTTGEEKQGSCTIVHHTGGRAMQWYDAGTRATIDAATIKGWMPAIFRTEGLVALQKKYGVGPGELRDAIKPLFILMESYGMEKITIDRSTGQPVISIDGEIIQ